MHVHKLPQGFNSWIEFRNYVQKNNPENVENNKSTLKMQLLVSGGDTPNYKVFTIRMDRLKMLCWDEVQKLRLTQQEVYNIISMMKQSNYVRNDKLVDFLIKTKI